MRRLLAALALSGLALTTACSDDDTATSSADLTCRAGQVGATKLAPTCKAPVNLDAVEAFRAHAVRASSAAGGAQRLADGVSNAVAHCFAEAVGAVLTNTIGVALGLEPVTVICTDVYAAEGRYAFANGTYTFQGEQRAGWQDSGVRVDTAATASLRVYLTEDAGALKKGDLVTADIHRIDSYLVNARIVADAKGKAAIAFDRPGPLVTLLGQGAEPPNPMRLADDTSARLARAFAIEGSVHSDFSDCGQGFRTVIDQTIPRTPVTEDVKPVLTAAVLTAPNVRISARLWDATYAPANPGAPSGYIEANVSGVAGVTSARIDLDDPKGERATMTVSCAP